MLTQDYPLIMPDIMFSQNKNEFVLIFTLKSIVFFKTSEREFNLKEIKPGVTT